MRGRTIWLLVIALVGTVGCGPGNGLNLARVNGKVTLNGEPLKNGTIIFEPDESKGTTGPQAIGTIMSDGTYILSSETAGDGAVVGHHKIGILGLEAEPVSEQAMPSPEDDPLKYLEAKTKSGLVAARNATKKNADRVVSGLDGKPFRVVVPEKVISTQTSGIIAKVESGSNTFNIDVNDEGVAQIK
ncbi:MAG: hypothetical protein AB7I30_02400 [Isosphaeraceae bacterium]